MKSTLPTCNRKACITLCGLLGWPLLASGATSDDPAPSATDPVRPHQAFDVGVEYARELFVDAASPPGGDGSLEAPFRSIADALAGVRPGTKVNVAPGRYAAIGTVAGLQGNATAPIAIKGRDGAVIDTGGSGVALHLVDPRFVVVEGLVIENTVPHGINIDDGGSYDSPAAHVVLRRMSFRNIGDGGNNDCLKMSGVDDFLVEDSRFEGCNRGEAIDMVGCHRGVISSNFFGATPGTAVQTKGGSADVLIHGNRFQYVGERAVNAGGSTGSPYFRPLDARHEAERIRVIANVIRDTGGTPIAFSGCLECVFANNTILGPGRHAARIIEENRSRAPGSGGHFINNVIVFQDLDGGDLVDVGPGASASGFSFGSNLWFAGDQPLDAEAGLGTGLPMAADSLTGKDPLLDPTGRPLPASPALHGGRPVPYGPFPDIDGRPFGDPPNHGAFARPDIPSRR